MTRPVDRDANERWSGTTANANANANDPLLPSSPSLSRPSIRRDRLAELHAAISASPMRVSTTTTTPSRAPRHAPDAPPRTTTTCSRPSNLLSSNLLSPTKSASGDPSSSHMTWSDAPTAIGTVPSPTLAKTALLTTFLDDVASVTTTLAQVHADLGDLHAAQTASLRTSSTAVTVPTPPHDRAWLASTTQRLYTALAQCRDTHLPALVARLHADLARDPDSASFFTAASAHLRSAATKYDACSRLLVAHCTSYTGSIRARLVRELRVVHPDADAASLDAYLDTDPGASPPPNRVVGGNAVTGIFAYEILRARSGLVTGMPPAARAAFQGIHDRHVELRELERGVEMVKGLLVDVDRMLAPPLVVIREVVEVGRVEMPSETTGEVERASLRSTVESGEGGEKGVDKVGREIRARVARTPWYLCMLVVGVLAIVALVVGVTVYAASRVNLVDMRLQREGAATRIDDAQPTLTDDMAVATSWPESPSTVWTTTEFVTTATASTSTTTIHAAVVTSTPAAGDRASPVPSPAMTVVDAPRLAPSTARP
ncbi:hypothetical protein GGF32_005575 [Allomyces javanicus]|nr:hypothetical protein GGF32_005575 [Allomyces javanicus]